MTNPHKRFQLMAMGGTFDHFHAGHESFIKYAATLSTKLLIGIMSDKYLGAKLHTEALQPYKVRFRSVLHFCRNQHIDCDLVELNDPYGPTISHDFPQIDSLCATKETEAGADKINEIRIASHLKPLPIFLAPLLNDQTHTPLHAEKIRAGAINRRGDSYPLSFPQGITIDRRQRQFFTNPLGPIVSTASHSKQTLAAVVGDYALSQFLKHNWPYQIGVYDLKNERLPFTDAQINQIKPTLTITNPAGEITAETFSQLSRLDYSAKHHIFVEGEEDLVTAALVLVMPLESVLYYGQPREGMVKLTMTEELKERIWKELRK